MLKHLTHLATLTGYKTSSVIIMNGYKTVYHYTTSWGAEGIEEDNFIRKASQHDFYGSGVYFSDWLVGRDCTKEEMGRINYGVTG